MIKNSWFNVPAGTWRSRIMAAAKKRGWDSDEAHYFFSAWGFGDSLRKITDCAKLRNLYALVTEKPSPLFAPEVKYAGQIEFVYTLQKQAGWDNDQLKQYMVRHYQKDHLNKLEEPELAQVMAVLRNVIKRKGVKS